MRFLPYQAKSLKRKTQNHNSKLKTIFVSRIAYRVHIYLDKLLCLFIDTDLVKLASGADISYPILIIYDVLVHIRERIVL